MTAAVAAGAVLAGLAGVKAFEARLPKAVVRAGILLFVLGPPAGLAYAMWALWRQALAPVDLVLLAVLSVVTGLGTSLGYHRLLTHRSFRTTRWIEAAVLPAGAMTVPSRPVDWRHGTSSTTRTPIARATRIVRIGLHNQAMFAVNSVCRTFGSQPFATHDESRNTWLVAALAFGEGWHNNHHAFPSMAYHGTGRPPDPTGLVNRGLERVDLAWDLRRPSDASVDRRRCPGGRSSW